MADLNSVNLTGTLGRDPELTYTPNGKSTAKTSLAVQGFSKDSTDWVNLVFWEKKADLAGQYLKKGNHIAVSGRLSIRAYTDKEGNKRTATEVVVSDFTFPRRDTGAPAQQSTPKTPSSWSSAPAEEQIDVDEIPF